MPPSRCDATIAHDDWFLRVGGATGTVAKTISAYAVAFSDAIHGTSLLPLPPPHRPG
jgi:hypothetical protein